MLRNGSAAVPPSRAIAVRFTVLLSAPSLANVIEPVKLPSVAELNDTTTFTGVLTSVLLCEITVGETENTPLVSLSVTVTSLVMKAPVTVIVFVTVLSSVAAKSRLEGSTSRVGTRGCATPVMGTVTVSTSSSAHERVIVALVLPAWVGA